MQWALVFALTLEEPTWGGTFDETHIHPEYGVSFWGASLSGCFCLGMVHIGHCDRCHAVSSIVLEIRSQNSAGLDHEQPGFAAGPALSRRLL